jgi:hypothetical protein
MMSFKYRCPRTGQEVHGHAADDLINGETYEPVTCTACGALISSIPKRGRFESKAKKWNSFAMVAAIHSAIRGGYS